MWPISLQATHKAPDIQCLPSWSHAKGPETLQDATVSSPQATLSTPTCLAPCLMLDTLPHDTPACGSSLCKRSTLPCMHAKCCLYRHSPSQKAGCTAAGLSGEKHEHDVTSACLKLPLAKTASCLLGHLKQTPSRSHVGALTRSTG